MPIDTPVELTISAKKVFITEDSKIHIDYAPSNIELESEVLLGIEVPFAYKTIEEAISSNYEYAKKEILNSLAEKYKNKYY